MTGEDEPDCAGSPLQQAEHWKRRERPGLEVLHEEAKREVRAVRRNMTALADTIQTSTPMNTTMPITPSSPKTDSFSATSSPVTHRAMPTTSPRPTSHVGNAFDRSADTDAATRSVPIGKTFSASTV